MSLFHHTYSDRFLEVGKPEALKVEEGNLIDEENESIDYENEPLEYFVYQAQEAARRAQICPHCLEPIGDKSCASNGPDLPYSHLTCLERPAYRMEAAQHALSCTSVEELEELLTLGAKLLSAKKAAKKL